jgi:hypothetical protein
MFAAWIEPVRLRQREQWQYWKNRNGVRTSKATAPHTQVPVGIATVYADRVDDLLERIAAGADDDEIGQLRIHADVLQGRGDPHGELIVVASERLVRDTPELRRREDALIAEQRTRLDGLIRSELRPTYRWHRGFVDAIAFDYPGDETFDALPALAADPVFRLLRRIELATQTLEGAGDVGPTVAELARLAPRFPRLVEIVVRFGESIGPQWVDGAADLNDVTPLYAAYPRLQELELGGDNAQLGAIDLPHLRRFAAPYLVIDNIRSIVAARLPQLVELALAFRRVRCDNVAATFGPLLHRDFGPQLTSLSLGPPDDATAYVIGELPSCPLARHVRRLAFRYATLDYRHYAQLVALAPQLRRLDRLELFERPIPAATLKSLHGAFGRALALV